MIKKNEVYITEITGMGCNMEGVAKINGFVVFVPFAILGEKVKVKILKVQKDFAFAKLLNIITPSRYRVEAPCPYFTKCGGCDCQHIDYNYACQLKRDMVKSTLEHIYKCEYNVNPTVKSENEFYYRNKIALPVCPQTRKVGMYAPNSHRIVPIQNCIIQEKWVEKLIDVINKFLEITSVSVYDENTQKGDIRHVVARSNGKDVLITIVVNNTTLKCTDILTKLISEKFESFGLNININLSNSNMILTDKFKHICGLTSLKFNDFAINYEVTNGSFLQVNNDIKNKIYESVLSNIANNEIVIEGYSGAGLMTAMLATKAKHVYGVEIVEEAVKNANDLMKKNNIKNVTNICGKCEVEIPKLISQFEKTTVVLDPPRKGCDINVIKALAQALPNKIIYVSCAPNTLARDIKNIMEMSNERYVVESVTPFDMFPQTKHVENLLVLKLKG